MVNSINQKIILILVFLNIIILLFGENDSNFNGVIKPPVTIMGIQTKPYVYELNYNSHSVDGFIKKLDHYRNIFEIKIDDDSLTGEITEDISTKDKIYYCNINAELNKKKLIGTIFLKNTSNDRLKSVIYINLKYEDSDINGEINCYPDYRDYNIKMIDIVITGTRNKVYDLKIGNGTLKGKMLGTFKGLEYNFSVNNLTNIDILFFLLLNLWETVTFREIKLP